MWSPRRPGDVERARERLLDVGGLTNAGQLRPADGARMRGLHVMRHRESEAGLAHAAGTDERDQPDVLVSKEAADRIDHTLAAEYRCGRRRRPPHRLRWRSTQSRRVTAGLRA